MPRVKGQLGPPLRDHQVREGMVALAEVKADGKRAWVRVVVVGEGVPAAGLRRWVLRAEAGERRGPSLMPRPASQLRRAPETESQLSVPAEAP